MRLCIATLLALLGGTASAADRDTLTLGGTGTAARAATEDNELAHGRYRGYYGWGGGYSYGYRGGYYNSFYRPAYYSNFYYAPRVVYPTYYVAPRPVFCAAPVYYYQPAVSFYIGIGGGASTAAPAVNLGAPPMQMPAQPGGLRYDGGPANPVPLPKPDAQPIPGADPLPISAKPTLRYKAYGEK